MRKEYVIVVCRNASGMPDAAMFASFVTDEQYDLGEHYDDAEAQAIEAGYEAPFICFDNSEHAELIAAGNAAISIKAAGHY